MKEIKFRGLDKNGNWHHGCLIYGKNGRCCISIVNENPISKNGDSWYIDTPCYEVLRETISQFTGLLDKNGNEIYEGDILREPPKNDWEKTNYSCFEVFFHDGNANIDYNIGYSMSRIHNKGSVCGGVILSFKPKTVKNMIIIGNIHENSELLK